MVEFDLHQFVGLAGIPLIVALLQFAKIFAPHADARVWPAATFVLAVAINLGLAFIFRTDLVVGVALGIVTALAASGFYSQAVTVGKPERRG